METSSLWEAVAALAAVIVPAFVLGFGAIWLVVHNGLTDVRKEIARLSERVARIEGHLGVGEPAE